MNEPSSVGNVIAIDGPAGSGKSTIARRVAERVGLPMLDTGAMYRALTFAVIRSGGDPADAAVATAAAQAADIVVDDTVTIDGVDVTAEIREPEVSAHVSVVAAHSGVRQVLVALQRRWLGAHGGGVLEGRDIGTVVTPEAPLKIYLTASPEVRAKRRAGEGAFDLEAAAANIAERDRIDMSRADSPLRPAGDAIIIDTSELTIDEVVDGIVAHALERGVRGGN
ncbi:MAG: (d)CMP kinase [Actinobacteria bacterium]|nr:(d)CMP kinase [Actinomycetota bacterium]